jgi:hypothetical protein
LEINGITQMDSLFRGVDSNYSPDALHPGFAQDGTSALSIGAMQDSKQLDAGRDLISSQNDLHQDPQMQQSMFRVQKSRRRDYTKAEKESFERWIVQNPNPNHSQRAEFARKYDLTDHQLQNLINNRRRKLKSMEKKMIIPVINFDDSASSQSKSPVYLCFLN